jgi:hypothetical protein
MERNRAPAWLGHSETQTTSRHRHSLYLSLLSPSVGQYPVLRIHKVYPLLCLSVDLETMLVPPPTVFTRVTLE